MTVSGKVKGNDSFTVNNTANIKMVASQKYRKIRLEKLHGFCSCSRCEAAAAEAAFSRYT